MKRKTVEILYNVFCLAFVAIVTLAYCLYMGIVDASKIIYFF